MRRSEIGPFAIVLHGHLGGRKGRDGQGGLFSELETVQRFRRLEEDDRCVGIYGHVWSGESSSIFDRWSVVVEEPIDNSKLFAERRWREEDPNLRVIFDSHSAPHEYLDLLQTRSKSRWTSLHRALGVFEDQNVQAETLLITRFDMEVSHRFRVPDCGEGEVLLANRKSEKLLTVNDLLFGIHSTQVGRFMGGLADLHRWSVRPTVGLREMVGSLGLQMRQVWKQDWDFVLAREKGLKWALARRFRSFTRL